MCLLACPGQARHSYCWLSASTSSNFGSTIDEPSDSSSAEIGTVHQTDAVQHSHSHDKTPVDAMNDLSLLSLTKLAFVSGAILGAIDVFLERDRPLLERVVVTHDRLLMSHGGYVGWSWTLRKVGGNVVSSSRSRVGPPYTRYMSKALAVRLPTHALPSTVGALGREASLLVKYRGTEIHHSFVRGALWLPFEDRTILASACQQEREICGTKPKGRGKLGRGLACGDPAS